jgi:hypothetical protein
MNVGRRRWATLACPFTDVEGVGDAPDSYAYDGKRVKKWNVSCDPYGQPWMPGDVIGCCLDMEVNKPTTTTVPPCSPWLAPLNSMSFLRRSLAKSRRAFRGSTLERLDCYEDCAYSQ